jgi:hypothetical protein
VFNIVQSGQSRESPEHPEVVAVADDCHGRSFLPDLWAEAHATEDFNRSVGFSPHGAGKLRHGGSVEIRDCTLRKSLEAGYWREWHGRVYNISRGLKCGERSDFLLSPLPRERITKNARDESGGEGQGEGALTMRSEDQPLIRPPATFSPYEGEKGRDRARWTLTDNSSTNTSFQAA